MPHHGGEFLDVCLEVANFPLQPIAPYLLLLELDDGGGGIRDEVGLADGRPA